MKIDFNGCQVLDMPSLYEFLAGKIPIEHISDIWFYFNSSQNSKFYYRRIKRLCDLLLSIFYLLLVSPLFLVIPVAIKLDSPGPVFFCQQRLGKDGKPFWIIKFRTMVDNAERDGPQWASQDDPRITRVGRILRKLRLDELPQLLNILKGEMSFIGPRPERENLSTPSSNWCRFSGKNIWARMLRKLKSWITRSKCPITVIASW